MWLPKSVFALFTISKDTVDALRVENSTLRVERDLLTSELASSRANSEWMRVRVNALEFERASLLEKAYGIRVPVPEITRVTPVQADATGMGFPSNLDVFNDLGDDLAKSLGLPSYS